MLKKVIASGIFLMFVTLTLTAGVTITLDEALQRAEAHNLSLASTSVDVQGAQRDIGTAWNLFLPSLSMSLSTSGMTPVFQAPETTVTTLTGPVTVSVPASNQGLNIGLTASFQLNPAVKDQFESYNVAYQIQQVTYQQAKAEIEKSVKQLFYYLIMQEKNIAVQEANLNLSQQRYEETQKKYEAGFASEVEVLSAQISVEQLKPSLQQAKNDYASNLLSLKALIGEELTTDLIPTGEIPVMNGGVEVTGVSDYLAHTYGVGLLDLNARQLEVNKELTKKQAYYPSLSVTGSYGLSLWSDSYSNTASDTFSYQVALAIPLDGFIKNSRTDVGMQKLDESLRKLSLQKEQVLSQMEVQVASQLQSIDMITMQMALAQKSLELTEKMYEMQETQYEEGYINVVDLEEAQNNLLSAKQGILALQYQYLTSLIELSSTLNIDMKELY